MRKYLSIPYMGSKIKLAFKICRLLQQRHPDIKTFYDVFGGGGAISFQALRLFNDVHYNEIDTSIVNLIEQLKQGIPDDWYDPITRERFFEEIEKDTAFSGMVKTCWSFGNYYGKGYLWGDCAEDKLLLHELCVKNTPELIEKARKQLGIGLPDKLKGDTIQERRLFLKKIISTRIDIQSLQRLQRLQGLQGLQSLQSLQTTNKDYRNLKFRPNSIIYCDPPYQGTADYNTRFNHNDFCDWCLRQDNPVYISEYNMPSQFIQVEKYAHRSTLSASNNRKKTIEKIYWNGKGSPLKTTLF